MRSKRTLLLLLLLVLLLPIGWLVRQATLATTQPDIANSSVSVQALTTTGTWNIHNFDLIYTAAFSRADHPDGPLVVYRATGADLRSSVPIIALQRSPLALTPQFFPAPDGHALALLNPLTSGYNTLLNGSELRLFPTDGSTSSLLVAQGVAAGDQLIWSADSQYLYYHTGSQERFFVPNGVGQAQTKRVQLPVVGYDEIHMVDMQGRDTLLLHRVMDGSSLRLVGLDQSGALILSVASQQKPVVLMRLATQKPILTPIVTLPADILPGNVLRVGSDGHSVVCERVLSWSPLRITQVSIDFSGKTISTLPPIFDTSRFGQGINPLTRSLDGQVLVMSQITAIRNDLLTQGIAGIPEQETLLLADIGSGSVQRLALPTGGQVVQAFWAPHLPQGQIRRLPSSLVSGMLAVRPHSGGVNLNAGVGQQDEWMLEAHAGLLADSPTLPKMCYGTCPQGLTGAPHVSAAILHGIAFVESNWHQFNASDYDINGEAIGSPVESYDGGWGEFQQTWGMPPQCNAHSNCRGDVTQIQNDESYNIGVGAQALINAWNGTAGVASNSDPNDPYKANDWFFAVWAYNGSYGNNPNDVPSSHYGQWYPGAPFSTIYEEYVWYFAAHPQANTSGWTDSFMPDLGSNALPPQSDFVNTSDSFVGCITCTIPDWLSGSYDREGVGVGAPDATTASAFQATFSQFGGEDIVGLPRDNGAGATVHQWANGWIQDFGGGSFQPGALMLANGTKTAYWVYGGVWSQYASVDYGAKGCHGYPTSSLALYSDPGLGSDSYARQNFQNGYIIWDATTRSIAADRCA